MALILITLLVTHQPLGGKPFTFLGDIFVEHITTLDAFPHVLEGCNMALVGVCYKMFPGSHCLEGWHLFTGLPPVL